MHIWGLFDDGNGCYRQAVDEYNVNMRGQHTITSIGIGDACINQDLAVNTLHQPNALWEQLDKPVKKPTKFGSNIDLKLLKDDMKNQIKFNKLNIKGINRYNMRSHIPLMLVQDILKRCEVYINKC